jgi:hypothetical protein
VKTALATAALLLAAPVLAGCGSEPDVAVDPGGDPGGSATPMPTEVPAAPGTVRTRSLATVMDTGSPELCLGPVAESYPPQCGGPALAGWDWLDHRGMFDHQGEIRWGTFMVTGTFDGTTFTATDAVAGALYDPAMSEPSQTPAPATTYSEGELAGIAERVGELPGAQGAYAADGHVLVDVVNDDGSLQDWVDGEYGANVVLVTSALVPVEAG